MSVTPSLSPYQTFLGWGDFSDLYLEESQTLSLRWEDGHLDAVSSSEDSGAGLRILKGLETRYGHASLPFPLSKPFVPGEAKALESIKKQLGINLSHGPVAPLAAPNWKKHKIKKYPQDIPFAAKVKLLERAFRAAQKGPLIRQVNINYGEKLKKIGYLNSDGDSYLEERLYVVFNLTVTVEKDGDRQNAYESLGGIIGFELFEGDIVEKVAAAVAERALQKLESPQAPVGEMPVVIASSAGGTLIHEAVGHSLEADAVFEGTSPAFLGKLGKPVANEKLTVYDDPTVALKRGSFYFDDEGVQSESSRLIENGVLKDYMFDRLSARKQGDVPMGMVGENPMRIGRFPECPIRLSPLERIILMTL